MASPASKMPIDPEDAYRRTYRLRKTGDRGLSIEMTIPKAAIEKIARREDISIDEALERFRAEAYYDDFDGVYVRFTEVTENE